MRVPLFVLVIWCLFGTGLLAVEELHPRITESGKIHLDESFSGVAVVKPWEPGGKAGAFSIVDGALQGVCAPDDRHGPAIGVPLTGRNFTISFRFKYTKPGYFLFLLDGESQYGGAAHLLRVSLTPTQLAIQQDRGEPASHVAQGKEKREADKVGRVLPAATKEQLADPKFYRVEKLAMQPSKVADGQWHQVLIEQNGNDVLVQLDALPPLAAKGAVFDAPKSRIVFLVGLAGTVLVDDVKVWENSRLAKVVPPVAK